MKKTMTIEKLLEENALRKPENEPYDPVAGIGCSGERKGVRIKGHGIMHLPVAMLKDTRYNRNASWNEIARLRFTYDFEFWCITCVKIRDKCGAGNIPFRLNPSQRKVLAKLEAMRHENRPIRLIMLKARQWGGSTLIQMYMAWIQIILRKCWNSLICAHVKDASAVIRGMYSRLLREYPAEYCDDDTPMRFRPFEKSQNQSEITGRDCTVAIGSSESQEAIRGSDIAMAHLSEVAFWRNTPFTNPENLIRATCAPIALLPLSLIVLESTANGVGNYFHTAWLRASAGTSDKLPIFVPWYEIEMYRLAVESPMIVWNSMDEYERKLWNEERLTLEQIYWYQQKRREYTTHRQMMAEYPSDAVEAFMSTDNNIFSPESVETLRKDCISPQLIGELSALSIKGQEALQQLHFCEDTTGKLKVWKQPELSPLLRNRYIVAVDVGGRSDSSDFSVISVFDRINMTQDNGIPIVVAQWRGHIDHDLLVWKAMQLARWYCNALLVVESNTLETENTEGDHGEYILTEVAKHYKNLYYRSTLDGKERPGFHTNRSTKTMAINSLVGIIRDHAYIEYDNDAVNEFVVYERKSNGSFGAKDGCHDDILMTRAIGLYICYHEKRPIPTPQSLKIP
ncbi:MAG: hypothetical protein RR513_06425 [Muribaculaceae bacterium]